MESSSRYKCIQSAQTGQPVCICLLTGLGQTATFKGMKAPVLLPYLLALLLCATLLATFLLLPILWFLTDATYYANVYAYQNFRMATSLLMHGYRLQTVTVKTDVDEKFLHTLLQAQEGFVFCSPVITQALQNLDTKRLEALVPLTWVGMGRQSPTALLFDRMIVNLDGEDVWQTVVERRKNEVLYVRNSDEQYYPTGIPSDYVLSKKDSESDTQFSERVRTTLGRQPIMHVLAPRLGAWALPLLQTSSLLWTVDASYIGLVKPSQRYGAIAEDLGRTFIGVLSTERMTVPAVKRLFTARQMRGSWL